MTSDASLAPSLRAAVDVFRACGWHTAARDDAADLPVGTPEQQRVARTGLASGEWGEWQWRDGLTYRANHVGVDEGVLALFAVRVGVDARRAVQVLRGVDDDDLVARVLATRGPQFAQAFVTAACRPRERDGEHATSTYAGSVVRLVDALDLPVPDAVDYLRDWAVYASLALTGTGELYPPSRGTCPAPVVLRRLREHVAAGMAAGVPATGPFGGVVPAAVAQGLLGRAEAVRLVTGALDAAQRPGDRKVWTQVLTGPLALTDAEVVAAADALVPVLAHGDAAVVAALGPQLVAGVPDDLLADVLTVTLTVRTRAVLRAVLEAAAARPRPDDATVATVAPLVLPHASGPDRALARAAAALVDAWGVTSPTAGGEAGAGADGARGTGIATDAAGAWRPTPDVWDVPRFTVPDVTADALTRAAAVLTRTPSDVVDVALEEFLHLANAVAWADRDAARSALAGVRGSSAAGLRSVPGWIAGTPGPAVDRPPRAGWRAVVHAPPEAREAAVVQRLGEVPVLLSTPTWVDLRVDPADLVARLRAYAEHDAVASEADLYLAATRCDAALVTDDVLAALDGLPVPVVLQDGRPADVTAGPTLAAYLRDPFRDPGLHGTGTATEWGPRPFPLPPALAALPYRVGAHDAYERPRHATFPAWGDAAGTELVTDEPAAAGRALRQLARRGTPLPPGLAVNLIGALRSPHPAATADTATAVHEAWARGLLRPGVADVRLLDWQEPPAQVAALARVCTELAAEGLLSVVWPLLDGLLTVSVQQPRVLHRGAGGLAVRQPRLLAGTAQVAEAVRTLLPEVEHAVATGLAEPSALALPGTRALAARGGTSRAVVAARAVVDRVGPVG